MICKVCGMEVESGEFCPHCGAQMEIPVNTTVEDPGKKLGLIALILGICALVLGSACSCSCALLGSLLPGAAAIVGIVLGIMGMKKSSAAGCKNTLALIGIILSGVALVVMLVFIIVNAIIGGAAGFSSALNSSYYY